MKKPHIFLNKQQLQISLILYNKMTLQVIRVENFNKVVWLALGHRQLHLK